MTTARRAEAETPRVTRTRPAGVIPALLLLLAAAACDMQTPTPAASPAFGGDGTDLGTGGAASLGGNPGSGAPSASSGGAAGGGIATTGGAPPASGGTVVATGGFVVATGGAVASTGGVAPGSGGEVAATGGEVAAGGTAGLPVNPACPGDAAAAYRATPGTIPGSVEAEDFDPAGYSDTTEGNEGDAYRTDVDVDLKAQDGGFSVGWMTAGEWLEYTVNVLVEGDYTVTVLAGAVEADRTLELSLCGAPLGGPIAVPRVADWGELATAVAGPVHLAAGLQVLRVTVGGADFLDLDRLIFTEGVAGTGGAPGTGGAATGGAATGGAGTGGAPHRKFVGNITTGWNAALDTNGMVFSDHWDQVTPENAGKWGSVQSSVTSNFNWSTLDSIYDYAQNKGLIFKQHTFVWGSQQPSGSITESHVRTWIQEFCARYPETRLIDVVNEPPPHTEPSYSNAIGGGTNGDWAWIANAFRWARESCPNAILILNDYNNIEWADQTQHFIDIVRTIQAAGAPIDAVGAQAHGLSGGGSSQNMQNLLTRLHEETGLPVYITEYDIDQANDADQLARYQQHIPFFLETEWIHGITVWGWIYGSTWVPASGLVRTDGTVRPAMTWLMETLERPVP